MLNEYGKIIKLNRELLCIKQDYICSKIGISKSHLSRMERNKENISLENVKSIFKAMDIEMANQNINEIFEEDFFKFYKNIAYDLDCQNEYQKIQSYSKYIKSSFSYVKYLLAQMIYSIVKNKDYNCKSYFYIENYLEYLESYQIQLFYDYIAFIFYCNKQYNHAIHYFQKAKSFKGNDISQSMLYYHQSLNYRHIGKLSEALQYSIKANHLFSETLNIRRLALSKIQQANIEANKRNFESSINIMLQCIQSLLMLNMRGDISYVYNNLLWTYLLWGKYDKVIELKDEAN